MNEFKFRIRDIVRFNNGDSHDYLVTDIRLEKNPWFYGGDDSEYIVYELLRNFDGIRVEAEEDDLVLIHRPIPGGKPQHPQYANLVKIPIVILMQEKQYVERNQMNERPPKTLDDWLDTYNDYKRLFELFGDPCYSVKMNKIVKKLQDFNSN